MVSVRSLKNAEIEQFHEIAGLLALVSTLRDKPEKTTPKPQSKYFCKLGIFTSMPCGVSFDSHRVSLQARVEAVSF